MRDRVNNHEAQITGESDRHGHHARERMAGKCEADVIGGDAFWVMGACAAVASVSVPRYESGARCTATAKEKNKSVRNEKVLFL